MVKAKFSRYGGSKLCVILGAPSTIEKWSYTQMALFSQKLLKILQKWHKQFVFIMNIMKLVQLLGLTSNFSEKCYFSTFSRSVI